MKIKLFRALRASTWWHHLIPPILSTAYALAWMGKLPPIEMPLPLFIFTISVIGSAAFGFWLNDWTDIEADRQVDKYNAASQITVLQRFIVLTALFITGWLPWFWIPVNPLARLLLAVLMLFFILYSVPPFRFKERSFLGIICDIHYGHVLPIAITLATFARLWRPDFQNAEVLVFLLFTLLYIKGFRNILEHQINDRKNDRKSHTRTFVLILGVLPAARWLSYVLIPLELLMIGFFLLFWKVGMLLLYLLFLLIYIFLFWRWGVFRLPRRSWNFKFWFVANDFYESWLPISILLLASLQQLSYAIILIIHLFLFPKSLQLLRWWSIEWSKMRFK